MKQNIISLIFGIIALSFALSAVVVLFYMQQFSGMPYTQFNIDNPELFSRAFGTAKIAMNAIFAVFGIGCGLVALLVGRNGIPGSNMRKIGMVMGVTGMVGTAVLLVASLL